MTFRFSRTWIRIFFQFWALWKDRKLVKKDKRIFEGQNLVGLILIDADTQISADIDVAM